jgi:uncharacterized protein
MHEPANVPCNGCTACCRHEAILLLPEHGDRIEDYDYEMVGSIAVVRLKPNGDCVYLGEHGCTIHDRAPVICRAFDCRRFYLSRTRNERRMLASRKGTGIASREVLDAGRARLNTLPEYRR